MTKTAEEMRAIAKLNRGPYDADGLMRDAMRRIKSLTEHGETWLMYSINLNIKSSGTWPNARSDEYVQTFFKNLEDLGYDLTYQRYSDSRSKYYHVTIEWGDK